MKVHERVRVGRRSEFFAWRQVTIFYVCVANVMPVIAAEFSFLKLNYFNQFFRVFKLIYCFKLIFHCV